MNLHEYQAKRLIAGFRLPVPTGVLIRSIEDAQKAIQTLPGNQWVLKAQVHAGGRMKAGGVRILKDKQAVLRAVRDLLHTNLVTYQTDAKGKPINALLIEEICEIEHEFYLGATLDRRLRKIVIMASREGGIEIEKVAKTSPEKILKLIVDPLLGVMPYQCRELGFRLGLKAEQIQEFTNIILGLGKMFLDCDLSLVEINPLALTSDGKLLCLDTKINVDDNALYRQNKLKEMRDITQEEERENHAKEWDLNFIPLEGDIGCMVNGAGLAMATMDLIKLHGGHPANFLDVGGSTTKQRVAEAFKIILSDNQVKGILVNIFGGIVRCDLIAEGIIEAVNEVGIKVPVVVRLQGNQSQRAMTLLAQRGLNIVPTKGLTEAAKLVIQKVSDEKGKMRA